jgi:predicted DNA-binding protein (MmcQ/YjbR family)
MRSNTLSVIAISLLLQACSTFYFGHTKEEWDSLTEDERLSAEKEYKHIIDSRQEVNHNDKIDERTQSIIDSGRSK